MIVDGQLGIMYTLSLIDSSGLNYIMFLHIIVKCARKKDGKVQQSVVEIKPESLVSRKYSAGTEHNLIKHKNH